MEDPRARQAALNLPGDQLLIYWGVNAVIESFWARMHVELLNREPWTTRGELANAIFEHLEIFHNRQRRHSALGMLTPAEFEDLRTITTAA